VQHHIAIGGNEIADQGRQTDAEVHINAVGKILHGPRRDLAGVSQASPRNIRLWRKSPAGIRNGFPSSLLSPTTVFSPSSTMAGTDTKSGEAGAMQALEIRPINLDRPGPGGVAQ